MEDQTPVTAMGSTNPQFDAQSAEPIAAEHATSFYETELHQEENQMPQATDEADVPTEQLTSSPEQNAGISTPQPAFEQTSAAQNTTTPTSEPQSAPVLEPQPQVEQSANPAGTAASAATPPPVPAEVAPSAGESSGKKAVLIIEDERPLAHALELKLGHSGFDATAVNSGEDAMNALSQKHFDIILLDLILPGMDGFELLRAIREKDQSAKIVILSNLGQPEDKARTEEFNITDYYIKSNIPLAAVVQSIQSLS